MPPTRGAAFPWLTHSLTSSRSSTSPLTPKAGPSSLPRASKETHTGFGQSAACATGRARAPATAGSQLRDWRMGRKPQARRPAGCQVPSQHKPVRSCTPRPEPPGTGTAKGGGRCNKVEGSHGEVSRAHGGGGNPSRYLQESGVLARLAGWALQRRRPALQGSGLAARPRARRRGGRRAG